MRQFFQFSLGQSFWFTWFTVHIWFISVSFHVCTHLLAKTDSTAKTYGSSIPWHHSSFDSQGAFLSTCGQGGLLTLGMRNMWSGQGSASSLNCPAILVLKFWSTRNESPIVLCWGQEEEASTSCLTIFVPRLWAFYLSFRSFSLGTSLVVQWLRICLPIQGTRFRSR